MLTEREEEILLQLCEEYDIIIDMYEDHEWLLSWILQTYHLSLQDDDIALC